MGQPKTLFGEDDDARLGRLRRVEEDRLRSGIGDTDDALRGSHAVRNVFLDQAKPGTAAAGRAGAGRAPRGESVDPTADAAASRSNDAPERPAASAGPSGGCALPAAAGSRATAPRATAPQTLTRGGDASGRSDAAAAAEAAGAHPTGSHAGRGADDAASSKAASSKDVPGGLLEGLEGCARLRKFFKRLLREWEALLARRPEAVRRSARGRTAAKTHRQCKDYMRHFFRLCRDDAVPAQIREGLLRIVALCRAREYRRAAGVYMDISIGRAAWPIGATSVGIHARAARERISTANIAHVMQDEACRKYITSVKRLMTFCQSRWPTDPSKMCVS
jgi:pre-mRNA-splicing factor 18